MIYGVQYVRVWIARIDAMNVITHVASVTLAPVRRGPNEQGN